MLRSPHAHAQRARAASDQMDRADHTRLQPTVMDLRNRVSGIKDPKRMLKPQTSNFDLRQLGQLQTASRMDRMIDWISMFKQV